MPHDLIGCWNQRKLKALIPRVVVFSNDPPSADRSILLFYGLMLGKICPNISHGNSKHFQMVVHIFSGSALFTELIAELNSTASC